MFSNLLQSILEGISIDNPTVEVEKNWQNVIAKAEAYFELDNPDAFLVYRNTDSDEDIIRIGRAAQEKVRVPLSIFSDEKNKLVDSEVQIVHPFEINPCFTGRPIRFLVSVFNNVIAEYPHAKYQFGVGKPELVDKNKTLRDPMVEEAVTILNDLNDLMQSMDINVIKSGMYLRDISSKLEEGVFRNYSRKVGLEVAKRLKNPQSEKDEVVQAKFLELCGYAMRNHNLVQQRQSQPRAKGDTNQFDYIIAPSSSSDFNNLLAESLIERSSACAVAKLITVPKTTNMDEVASPQSRLELAQRRANMQNRSRYAVVEYRQCPSCGFKFGKDKIKPGAAETDAKGKPVTNVYYKGKQYNVDQLRQIGGELNMHCGAPVDNSGKYDPNGVGVKHCPATLDSLETVLRTSPTDRAIPGITFKSIAAKDVKAANPRLDKKTGKMIPAVPIPTFDTWDELANYWVDTEFNKIEKSLNRNTGTMQIKNISQDKRRFAKLFGTPESHAERLGDIKDKKCLIIDDNIAGGSTIELIEQILKAYGPSIIDAFVPLKLMTLD